jgi:hypothetical protein
MSDIEALENEVAECKTRLHNAERRLADAIVASAEFSVGDLVIADGKEAIVRKVTARWGRHLAYHVSFKKKNGEWMSRVTEIWGRIERTA